LCSPGFVTQLPIPELECAVQYSTLFVTLDPDAVTKLTIAPLPNTACFHTPTFLLQTIRLRLKPQTAAAVAFVRLLLIMNHAHSMTLLHKY
jgi:hypothetical protein